MIYHANTNKKAGVAILKLDKVDFRKKIIGNKKGHYIIIKS